jgi:putative ABC transport system permease protein
MRRNIMLKNYFKVAFRNLRSQKIYAVINIAGLAVGLACCFVIMLHVIYELSYDKHHEHADRIYRVTTHINFSGEYVESAAGPAPMGPTLDRTVPEVEAVVRFRPRGNYLVRGEDFDSNIKEEKLVFADSDIFRVFTIPFLYGEAERALYRPHTIVISRSAAMRHFKRPDAVGETLVIDNNIMFEVTGVMEDMPGTSHFHFDFLMSMSTIREAESDFWLSNNFRTYILLREGADPSGMTSHFESIKKTHIEPQLDQFLDVTMEQFEAAGNSVDYRLQPLTRIHLHSDLTGEFEPNSSILYVYIFSGLAFFILILACINFMNLATARSAGRAREVGVRKTLGSGRRQLAAQFLVESLLMSVLAFLLALLMIELTLPYMNKLSGHAIVDDYLTNPILLSAIIGIVALTGLAAGSYPALILSAVQPVNALKGIYGGGTDGSNFRKSLVIFQFSISVAIIVGLLVINKQLQFIQQKSLGFDKEQVVIVHDAYTLGALPSVQSFKEEILGYPVFSSGTISSFFPVKGFGIDNRTYWPKGASPTQDNTVSMQRWRVDEDYIETLGMEIIEGRYFSKLHGTDVNAVILNESAAQKFNFDNPVGEVITIYGSGDDGSLDTDVLLEYRVVGIVKDFHYESLRETITPLGLFLEPTTGNMAFRITGGSAAEALSILEEEWNRFAPGQPLNYSFLDQRFDQMYRAENRIQDLMTVFSVLALLIACLGLYGLSANTVEIRRKEIGIRKVLGAHVIGIVILLSKDFLKLVIIGLAIAAPIAWYAMNRWLEDFAYRIEIGWWVFALAGGLALVIALLTVSVQAVRAALANPVEALRYE